MKKDMLKEGGKIAAVTILIIGLIYGISWVATCGIIKLIIICFGFGFKWSIAAGIWILMIILRGIFTSGNN